MIINIWGTFGRFGTYSFYYSHQITSGEGGMIVCNDVNDYNLLKSMRSHGWSRDTDLHKNYQKNTKNLINKISFCKSWLQSKANRYTGSHCI